MRGFKLRTFAPLTRPAETIMPLVFGVLFWIGCAAPAKIDPLHLSGPGWTIRQGQALWRPAGDKPEIVGDVVLSTHPSRGSFIQFSKTLPILSARISPAGWEFDLIAESQRHSGSGTPPRRLVWLQLLRAVDGEEIPSRWNVAHPGDDYITLEDTFRGERLEVRFQKADSSP